MTHSNKKNIVIKKMSYKTSQEILEKIAASQLLQISAKTIYLFICFV